MTKKAVLSVTGKWEEKLKNTIQVRDLAPFTVDEPKKLGGSNSGPNPLEYFLGALSSCTSIMTSFVAKEIDFKYNEFEISTSGELDPKGFQGVKGIQTYFETVTLKITIETDEDEEALKELQEKVEQRCPLFNLLLDAGVKVNSEWGRK